MSTRLSDGTGDSLISQDWLRQDTDIDGSSARLGGSEPLAGGFGPPAGTVAVGREGQSCAPLEAVTADSKGPAANSLVPGRKPDPGLSVFPPQPRPRTPARLSSPTSYQPLTFYCEPPKIWRFVKPRESCSYVKISSLFYKKIFSCPCG